jgi:hypothetical protein
VHRLQPHFISFSFQRAQASPHASLRTCKGFGLAALKRLPRSDERYLTSFFERPRASPHASYPFSFDRAQAPPHVSLLFLRTHTGFGLAALKHLPRSDERYLISIFERAQALPHASHPSPSKAHRLQPRGSHTPIGILHQCLHQQSLLHSLCNPSIGSIYRHCVASTSTKRHQSPPR